MSVVGAKVLLFTASGLMVGNIYRDVMHWVVTLNMRDWFWVLLASVAFGAFCMRGFGSRSSY